MSYGLSKNKVEFNCIEMWWVFPLKLLHSSLSLSCALSIPTEVCTIVADPTCQVAQNTVCSPTDVGDTCLLTVRRAFTGSGTYCLNLTLGDNASLALTSMLVSVPGRSEFCFMLVYTFHAADKGLRVSCSSYSELSYQCLILFWCKIHSVIVNVDLGAGIKIHQQIYLAKRRPGRGARWEGG